MNIQSSLNELYAPLPKDEALFEDDFDKKVEKVSHMLEEGKISKKDASILLGLAFRVYAKKEKREMRKTLAPQRATKMTTILFDYLRYAA